MAAIVGPDAVALVRVTGAEKAFAAERDQAGRAHSARELSSPQDVPGGAHVEWHHGDHGRVLIQVPAAPERQPDAPDQQQQQLELQTDAQRLTRERREAEAKRQAEAKQQTEAKTRAENKRASLLEPGKVVDRTPMTARQWAQRISQPDAGVDVLGPDRTTRGELLSQCFRFEDGDYHGLRMGRALVLVPASPQLEAMRKIDDPGEVTVRLDPGGRLHLEARAAPERGGPQEREDLALRLERERAARALRGRLAAEGVLARAPGREDHHMSSKGPQLHGRLVDSEPLSGHRGHVVALELEGKDVVFFTVDSAARAYADREAMRLASRTIEAPEPGSSLRVDVGQRICFSGEKEAARQLRKLQTQLEREKKQKPDRDRGPSR